MAGLWASFEDAKKVVVLVLILLFVTFGCGFFSGLLIGMRVTRTETKKPCDPLTEVCGKPCDPLTLENCPK
jgi:hypothetical protein